ncbi:MAG: hypothetical protein COB46_02110 [Rhodospirillaceae bacterium]|nr:MAG: hypothetical protein COB46_02110 [Rhodospirillaceae bacterium]
MPRTPASLPPQNLKTTPVLQKTPDPQLLWPSVCDETCETKDLSHAPSPTSINLRYQKNYEDETRPTQGSCNFWSTVMNVRKLYLMDAHIDGLTMRKIRDYLNEGSNAKDFPIKEIKIMCGSNDKDNVQAAFDDMKNKLMEKQPQPSIELRQSLDKTKFPFLHDRFAVLDNELWHFGATVGGLHQSLNAYSRGWSASEYRFIDMFNKAWERSSD